MENFDNLSNNHNNKHSSLKKTGTYSLALLITLLVAYVSYSFKLPSFNTSVNGLPILKEETSDSSVYKEKTSTTISLDDLLNSLKNSSDEETQSVESESSQEIFSSENQVDNTSNSVSKPGNNSSSKPFEDGEVTPPTDFIPDDDNAPKPETPTNPPANTSDSVNSSEESGTSTPPSPNVDIVTVSVSGKTQVMSAFDAVCGWVATEINYNYPKEAIKAQAVAAYTYIKYYNASGQTPVIAVASPHNNIKNAVNEIIGITMYNGDRIAFTPWFAMSAGITLNSEQVWGGTVSNLKSVDSSIEKGYSDGYSSYKSTVTYSASSIKTKLQSLYSITLSDDKKNWFNIKNYHQTTSFENKTIGYVKDCLIDGQKTISGRAVRESVLNGLDGKRFRSSAFDNPVYNSSDDSFTFTVYGYGHGCGMSQVGAKLYASNGWSYKEILSHYYKGITIK
ncbi:MAG: SpoIID/LytB domain-containing protein [Oscillospiraceae bacterium]